MPEGDTIHKVAAAMAPRLTRAPVRGLRLAARHGASPRAVRVEGVRAHGKHLLIDLDGARTLRVHLGMYGSWHRYRPGEAWKKPARRASVVLETEGHVFVCFSAKEVQVLDSGGLAARELFHRLGPDLLDPATGVDALVERARRIADGTAPLVDVLLDQRIACGVGNVYKSELLFLAGLAPLRRLDDVDDAILGALYGRAAQLLARNLGGGPRVTRFEGDGRGRLWVYRRAGLECLACAGARIEHASLGRDARSSYWCPACQAA